MKVTKKKAAGKLKEILDEFHSLPQKEQILQVLLFTVSIAALGWAYMQGKYMGKAVCKKLYRTT